MLVFLLMTIFQILSYLLKAIMEAASKQIFLVHDSRPPNIQHLLTVVCLFPAMVLT